MFYGGMVKESSFIIDMHKRLFFIPPAYLTIWVDHFSNGIKKIDFGPQSEEIRECLLSWVKSFGKSTLNAKDDEIKKTPPTEEATEAKKVVPAK